jgi:hypothetical protein
MRLPSDATLVPIEHFELNNTASSLGSLERSFCDSVEGAVQKRLQELQGEGAPSAEDSTKLTLRIRCDTRDAELLLLPVKDRPSPALLQKLENAVDGCSRRIPCPYEIRDQYGLYYEFQIRISL